MADVPARTEMPEAEGFIRRQAAMNVTTGAIRGSKKIHVGPLNVAMREITLEPGSGEPPVGDFRLRRSVGFLTKNSGNL